MGEGQNPDLRSPLRLSDLVDKLLAIDRVSAVDEAKSLTSKYLAFRRISKRVTLFGDAPTTSVGCLWTNPTSFLTVLPVCTMPVHQIIFKTLVKRLLTNMYRIITVPRSTYLPDLSVCSLLMGSSVWLVTAYSLRKLLDDRCSVVSGDPFCDRLVAPLEIKNLLTKLRSAYLSRISTRLSRWFYLQVVDHPISHCDDHEKPDWHSAFPGLSSILHPDIQMRQALFHYQKKRRSVRGCKAFPKAPKILSTAKEFAVGDLVRNDLPVNVFCSPQLFCEFRAVRWSSHHFPCLSA